MYQPKTVAAREVKFKLYETTKKQVDVTMVHSKSYYYHDTQQYWWGGMVMPFELEGNQNSSRSFTIVIFIYLFFFLLFDILVQII